VAHLERWAKRRVSRVSNALFTHKILKIKTMKADIVTLCHSAVVCENRLSILGAFDTIIAPQLPHAFPPFAVAVRIKFEPEESGDCQLKVTVLDIDGQIAVQADVGLRLPTVSDLRPTGTLNMVFPISGMNLRLHGEHAVDLSLSSGSSIRTSFYVRAP